MQSRILQYACMFMLVFVMTTRCLAEEHEIDGATQDLVEKLNTRADDDSLDRTQHEAIHQAYETDPAPQDLVKNLNTRDDENNNDDSLDRTQYETRR